MTNWCVGNSSYVNRQPQPPIATTAVIPNPALLDEESLPARKVNAVYLHFGKDFSPPDIYQGYRVRNDRSKRCHGDGEDLLSQKSLLPDYQEYTTIVHK